MADLTVQKIDLTGMTPTFSNCDINGDTFSNGGRVFLYFKNNDTASKEITISSLRPCNQGYIHNVVLTVPAGGEIMVGAFSPIRFNDTSQKVSISYSDTTNLQVAALELTL